MKVMMQAESRVGNMITLNQPVNVSATTLLNLRSPLRIAYLILINLVFLSAFILDAYAFSTEGMVGYSLGKKE